MSVYQLVFAKIFKFWNHWFLIEIFKKECFCFDFLPCLSFHPSGLSAILSVCLPLQLRRIFVRIFFSDSRNRGVSCTVVENAELNEDVIAQSDAVFSAGGDGIFLMAANKVVDINKPVIGINTGEFN